jgi:hypothetical protein
MQNVCKPLWRPSNKYEFSTKMYVTKIWCEGADWMFLNSSAPVSLSRWFFSMKFPLRRRFFTPIRKFKFLSNQRSGIQPDFNTIPGNTPFLHSPSRCHDDSADVRSVNTFYIITLSRPKFNGALCDRHLFSKLDDKSRCRFALRFCDYAMRPVGLTGWPAARDDKL